ncbi:hypothetical protein BGZ97_009204, partial [Linnemannia gamsii]
DNGALFSITYNLNYKVVRNTSLNTTYILTQCGTPPPKATVIPPTNTTVFIQIPVTNLASLATTAVSYIEMLGKQAAIKAVDTEGLVSSPCVQSGLEKGTIVGLEDTNSTLRAEQMKKFDVIFSSFGNDPGTENKTVITSEVEDPSPLKSFERTDWPTPTTGRDWFGGAVAMDDAVLQDLVRAIHPELFKISQYNWIRNIAKNEPQQLLTSANCTAADDATSPVPDRALSCANLQAGVSSGNGGASVNSGGLVNSGLTLVLGVFATLAILF